MKQNDILQQRQEIDILKMCAHPNIIKMIECFETLDQYQIVLEHMSGQDLCKYIEYRSLSEE